MSEAEQVTRESKSNEKKTSRRTLLLCALLAIVTVAWAVQRAMKAFRPPAALELARSAVEEGEFSAAVEQYERHLTNSPKDWDVRVEFAYVLTQLDRPRALDELRKVPPNTEAHVHALRQVASLCLQMKRFEEAEDALKALIALEPQDPTSHLMLAELHFRQRRAALALPHARKSAAFDSNQPRAHFLTAEILDELGRPSEMIGPLNRALALEPDNYAAHLNLCYAYSEAGRFEESKEHAEYCLSQDPSDADARRFLALALRDKGKTDQALKEIERVLSLKPNDQQANLLMAELLLFKNRPQEALDRLKPFYAAFKENRRLVSLLARAASSSGNVAAAREYRTQLEKLRKQ